MACQASGTNSAPGEHYSKPIFGTSQPLHGPRELWMNNGSEPEWIDPGKCNDSSGGVVITNLFAGLTQADPNTEAPMADIAQSWEVSDDGRTYTFTLRHSVWSDGQPLTAEDFAYAYRRVLAPATASHYASMFYVLGNGEPFNLQAVWLTGTPKSVDANALKAYLGEVAPVERVVPGLDGAGSAGYFVYASDSGHPTRQLLLELNGTTRWGATLSVRNVDESFVGVHALDALHLRVRLQNPVPFFLHLTSYHTFMPVPRHLLQRLASEGRNEDAWTRPEHIVSNGAYTLESWHFKHYFTLKKNDRYWNAEQVHIEKVKALQIESATTALNMYRAGELDWLGVGTPVPSEFLDALRHTQDFKETPFLAQYYYVFNMAAPPLDNPLVRHALNLSIDRQSLTRYVLRGGEIPSADVVPTGIVGYNNQQAPLFDPNRARAYLREAGYPDGKGMPTLTLTYNTADNHRQIAQAVQDMWHRYLNIEVELENQEWRVFLQNVSMRNFQIARFAWVGDYPDPNTFLAELFASHAGNNLAGFRDPAFDVLLEKANATRDVAQRMQLLHEAEARLMQTTPVAGLFGYTRSTMIKPYVTGLTHSIMERHPIKWMAIHETRTP